MSYIALYRQYRPQKFSEVAGQKVIVQTLKNALLRNQIGHAYLFSGPRGTGKTSIAKIFGKAVNCLKMPANDACGECDICKGLQSGSIGDIIEIDAASNSRVEDMRELISNANFSPSVCKYKVYILDEVHMLSQSAFNALLKTLEEPPKHVIFILATTEVHKIPPTILSRCQRFDFRNIEVKDIVEKLNEIVEEEKINIDPDAIVAIAENAEGALRDALSLLDQVISFTDDHISIDDVHKVAGSVSSVVLGNMVQAILDKDTNEVMTILEALIDEGKEITKIVADLTMALRDILKTKVTDEKDLRYEVIAEKIQLEKIYFYLDLLNTLQQDIKFTNQKRVYVELTLIKMMSHEILDKINNEAEIKELRRQVLEINDKLSSGNFKVEEIAPSKKPLVTTAEIEVILNSGNNQKRTFIQSEWFNNLTRVPDGLEMTAELLAKVEVVAGSDRELVLVADNLELAHDLYQANVKKQALRLIKQIDKSIKNYHVILDSDWDKILNVFQDQWKSGCKKPILPKIDLKIYEYEKPKEEIKTVTMAQDYFGEDKVIIKE
ncbi:MAG: DNA polymerase III subunit gamma/tau [Acholeplasmataceae bacterium]|jgi:DNA polymerase-3 subunit gamma/tau